MHADLALALKEVLVGESQVGEIELLANDVSVISTTLAKLLLVQM